MLGTQMACFFAILLLADDAHFVTIYDVGRILVSGVAVQASGKGSWSFMAVGAG